MKTKRPSPNAVKSRAAKGAGIAVANPAAAKRATAMRGVVARRNRSMKKEMC